MHDDDYLLKIKIGRIKLLRLKHTFDVRLQTFDLVSEPSFFNAEYLAKNFLGINTEELLKNKKNKKW